MAKMEEKAKTKVLLVLVVLLSGLAFLGKTILSRLTSGVFSVDKNGGLAIQGSKGDFSFQQGGSLPQNFPGDFPVYPGAVLTGSWTAQGDKGQGISVVWETTDDVSKVSDYYKTQLAGSDWKVTTTFNSSDSSTFSFEKDDKSGFMGITRTDNKTTISVTLGTRK